MATVVVNHTPSGGPADPTALVDGPTYDSDPHIVTGLENVPNVDTTDSGNINFIQSGTGATSRTIQEKLRDFVAAEDFGAVGDGATDDTTAIQNALNTGKRVILQAKTYRITTLSMNIDGMQLVGQGGQAPYRRTVLTSSSTTASMIIASASYLRIQGILFTRTVVAGTTAYGVLFSTVSNFTLLDDLYIENQYIGLQLASASFAFAQNISLFNNLNDGFQMVNTGQNLQWQLFNITSQGNAGRGFLVVNNAGSGASLGQWSKLSTYSNSGIGLAVVATSGASAINGVRCSDSFFGEDGNSEIYLDTYGGLHSFNNVFVEGAGISPTGPTGSTPASNIGYGLQVTANNTGFKFTSGNINTSSLGGANVAATVVNEISSTKIDANFGPGITAADGSKCVFNGNTIISNVGGAINYSTNASSAVAHGNFPSSIDNNLATAVSGIGAIEYKITGVNFNSANTDTAINITLPPGISRYIIQGIRISNASASITTATAGVFSATGGGGTAVASTQAMTVSTAAANTANNMQLMVQAVNNGNTTLNFTQLFFRVTTPQGSAATADVAVLIFPQS